MSDKIFLQANWPVPEFVKAGTTLRTGGISLAPFDALNLGAHVGDLDAHVRRNRALVQDRLQLPQEPLWLNQVHGTGVVDADEVKSATLPDADGAITRRRGSVLAVLTADCLPIVLCAPDRAVLAVAHGGWRGLADGIVNTILAAMKVVPQELYAWLGPAIGPACFEVGAEVRDRFVSGDARMSRCFSATPNGRFMADLYAIARRQLTALGVSRISGGGRCTFTDARRFYSYRRDTVTGRMATLAWMNGPG